MQFSKPPTPEELRQRVTKWLKSEEEKLPVDADFAHAAKYASGTYIIEEDAE